MLPKKKGYHRHHIIPKHLGGTDDDDNIVYLTPEQHALVHLELYEKFGNYSDAQAFNTLSSQWLDGRSINGYKQTPEHVAKRISSIDYTSVSSKLKGRQSPTKGMKFEYRPKPKISKKQKGTQKSTETKKKISESLMGKTSPKKIEFYCVYCHERMLPSRMDRHNEERCKLKLGRKK